MSSLRDIGYDLASAVADLVDNSIDAGAENVSVDFVAEGPDSWIRVSDDGLGMAGIELDEAMRYGTRARLRGARRSDISVSDSRRRHCLSAVASRSPRAASRGDGSASAAGISMKSSRATRGTWYG